MVRSFVCAFVRSCLIQFALGSFYSDGPHKRIYIMKVYSDRNKWNEYNYVKNIDIIAVGKLQVGQQFMKLGSLLYMR